MYVTWAELQYYCVIEGIIVLSADGPIVVPGISLNDLSDG
jgi:hypothetical protein